MLAAEHISIRLDGKQILTDISFTLSEPGLYFLIGPNGSGKSTLLKILSGALNGFEGSVCLNRKTITAYRLEELAVLRSFLPQHESLRFNFSVEEAVFWGSYQKRAKNTETHKKQVEVQLKEMQLCSLRHQSYTTLSGGERQRVRLAQIFTQCALNPQKQFIFLDEPLQGLDIRFQENMFESLKTMALNTIVLVALHDLHWITSHNNVRTLLLSKGRLIADETNLLPAKIRKAFKDEILV